MIGLVLRVPLDLTVLCLCSRHVAYFRRLEMTVHSRGELPQTYMMNVSPHQSTDDLHYQELWHPTLQFSAPTSFFLFLYMVPSSQLLLQPSLNCSLSSCPQKPTKHHLFRLFQFQETEGFHQSRTTQRSVCKRMSYVLRIQVRGVDRANSIILEHKHTLEYKLFSKEM